MAYEMKPDTGSLFKNDKRETDSHPNARGSALIDGVAYWVDAWTNDSNGNKYQSLKFKRKDKQEKAVQKPAPKTAFDDMSDVPF